MNNKNHKILILFKVTLLASLVLFISTTRASADTTGNEIQIAGQPDKLILQLGLRWAGVEFELRTDAGIFPVPVIVDQSGVLMMDLGGSKTYTLSCVSSSVPVPGPEPAESGAYTIPNVESSEKNTSGISAVHLFIFVAGLAAAAGGLFAMWYLRHMREAYDYGYDDEEDGEYE